MITTLYYRRELRLYINCWVKKILYYCHIIIYLIVGLFLPILISSLFVIHQLVYLQLIGIARSHKSTHSPCQQRCQCCPHWYRRQLQHFSYCRRSFHSTMRLPGEAQLHESLAYESLQHVAWPNPASSLSMVSPHKTPPQSPHNPPLSNSLTSFRVRRQDSKPGNNYPVQAGRSQTCSWCPATSKKEGYIKIATIVEDTANARTPGWPNWLQQQIWLVLVLVTCLSLFTIRLAVLCVLDGNAHLFLPPKFSWGGLRVEDM